MELWQEIFLNILKDEKIKIILPKHPDTERIFNSVCYQTLQEIQHVLKDPSLDDKECFCKIEEIIRIFEDLGSDCGFRHDFS